MTHTKQPRGKSQTPGWPKLSLSSGADASVPFVTLQGMFAEFLELRVFLKLTDTTITLLPENMDNVCTATGPLTM